MKFLNLLDCYVNVSTVQVVLSNAHAISCYFCRRTNTISPFLFLFFTSLFSIHYVIVRDGCSIIQLS